MGKFKVGDRVRVIDDSGSAAYKVGEEGVVTRVSPVSVPGHTQLVEIEGKDGLAMFGKRFEHVAAVAPATAILTVEPGKLYKTRDGRKVGPIRFSSRGIEFATADGFSHDQWYTQHNPNFDGSYINASIAGELDHDLVAEWVVEAGKSYLDTEGNVIGPMFTLQEGFFAAVSGNGQSWRTDGSVYGKSGNPNPLVREYKEEVAAPVPSPNISGSLKLTPTPRATYLPEPGDRVLIEAAVTGATTSRKGTHYNVTLTTVGGKKVSLHFLAEDLIILPDEPVAADNDNGPPPLAPNTAAAFDDLCGSIFGLTMRAA